MGDFLISNTMHYSHYNFKKIDDNNELSIWDLSTADHPQFLARARFDQTKLVSVGR